MPRRAPRTTTTPSALGRRAVVAAAGLSAFLWAGCDVPRWKAAAEPPDATLFVDGRARPEPRVTGPIPYYGVVDLCAVPAPGSAPPRRAMRAELEIEEPVTPWIFPLDFVVESLNALVVADPIPEATLAAPLRDDVPTQEAEPEDVQEFRARGRRTVTER